MQAASVPSDRVPISSLGKWPVATAGNSGGYTWPGTMVRSQSITSFPIRVSALLKGLISRD
jgi:hypothetical protein